MVSLLLLVSTTGIIINKHYSGGKLFSSAMFVEPESCCESSCCHHDHQSNCHDETSFYKLVTDYVKSEINEPARELTSRIDFYVDITQHMATSWSHTLNSNLKLPDAEAPPPTESLPLRYHSLLL